MEPSPQELKLTPDLLEYARAVALKEAPKYCKCRLARPTGSKSKLDEQPWADVVQQAILELLRRPPKYDPTRGASPKTLIYTIVQRAVMKAAERESRQADRFRQFPQSVECDDEEPAEQQISEKRTVELTRS